MNTIEFLMSNDFTKEAIARFLGFTSFDYALPQDWVDEMNYLDVDTAFYIFEYDSGTLGKPVNLRERLMTKLIAEIKVSRVDISKDMLAYIGEHLRF